MFEAKLTIQVPISFGTVEVQIFAENSGETLVEMIDAFDNGEAPVQLKEGCFYEYKITKGYSLFLPEIVSQSKIDDSAGRISPNIYVGTLVIDILDHESHKCGEVKLEVQSTKADYRSEYRHMLEEITEKCTDLLLQHSSPVSQYFEIDNNKDARVLYQRFAFIKSIIDSVEFRDSVNKVISEPVTRWEEIEAITDIRNVKRFNRTCLKQLSSCSNRSNLPENHPLINVLPTIPTKIRVSNKSETIDTPENRFVKHALLSFQSFCSDIKTKLNDKSRISNEAELLVDNLEQYLSHSVFKAITTPNTIPLNSPVLQKKEGYREILRVWLMFDLAAKMIWHGGDDVYSGNKRDVAVLYEYWLFFKLLDIVKEVFSIDSLSTEKLIEDTNDGIGLKLRQGRFLPIEGTYVSDNRSFRVEFSYNRTFSGDSQFPNPGSWTRNLRPDYTISIWPLGIEQEQAENEELIVHMHFDAKYKVDDIQRIIGEDEDLDDEKKEQRKGTYKRGDLLKMHAYRDAIRRTAGAYVIYPGTDSIIKRGFHELIPGLGAFAIRPSKSDDGSNELKKFLKEVVLHFLNRASQREKISLKTYVTYKDPNPLELNDSLPEAYGVNRHFIPDETFVLVAYYKNENYDWICKSGLFNIRAGSSRGSLRLGPGEAGAKYILLHTMGETITGKLFKVNDIGPRIFSRAVLERKNYPKDNAKQGNLYFVYKVDEVKDKEFLNMKWDITKLDRFKKGRGSAIPFCVTLTELMQAKLH